MRIDVPPASFYRGNAFFRGFGIPLRVIHVEGGPVFPPHRHDFTELVVVYAGAGVHSMAGEERRIGPGEVLLIPRGLEHTYTDTGELSYVNVIFDAGILLDEPLVGEVSLEASDRRERAGPPEPFRLSAFGLREALAMVNRMDQELYRKEEGYELAARAAFHLLWVYLARAQSWGEPDEGSSVARVRRLVERVSRNSSQALSVGDMAKDARTSERNFRREFKRATGEAPVAYVNRLRIEEACALLSSTDKTVTQIAGLVGFEDPAYFTRAFKRVLGTSPKAYRSKKQGLRGTPPTGLA